MRCRNKNLYGCKKIFKRNPIKRPITDAGVRINRPKDSSLRLYQEKESKKDKLSNIGKVWKQKKKLMKTMTNLMEEKDSKFLLDFYQPIKFKGFHVTLTSTMAFKNWQVIKCRLIIDEAEFECYCWKLYLDFFGKMSKIKPSGTQFLENY